MILGRTNGGAVYVFETPVRLLVADDDPIMREFAHAQLAHPGGTVTTVRDGEEAWAALERSPGGFDLVLSDLEMPNLNGFGLLDRIRRSPRHAHVPVVVITSRDDMFAIDRAYEVGATSFVAKPVNWRLLGYQLRYVLRASRMEAEIRSAWDEAEQASNLKRALLALLQHETRTPLNAIIGYAEILRAALIDPAECRDHVLHVLDAARDLDEILRRIFYFAQLSSSAMALDIETVAAAHLTEEAVRGCWRRAEAAGVGLRIRDDAPGCVVACDVRHLTTALRELLANAIAYSPRGGTVEVAITSPAPGQAAIEVRDGGPGLDPQQLRRCLEAFAQGGDYLTRSVGGLGLGLPTAQRIAEMHGGRLDLASGAGEGTRARLILPLAAEAAAA